ncbi:MAG: YncE family protein [Acidimicrobiales bacterium]|jgi:YVTN family beta-propeller protein
MSKKRQFHMLMGRAGPANRNGRLAAALGATALAWAGVTGFAVPGPAGALLAPRAPAASAPAGLNPQGAVVDPATHTLYVADGKGNAVSVIDTATCNAQLGMGCAKAVATVHLGPQPVVEPGQSGAFPTAIDLDFATDTVYTANANSDTVSVINGSLCNAAVTTGCARSPRTVTVGLNPVDIRVDQATNSVYVANNGNNGTGDTVSVIDGKICNGTDTSGCIQAPQSVTIGFGPSGVAVDPVTDTVYAATVNDANNTVTTGHYQTVWVINGATCNAMVSSGCGQRPPSVRAGDGSIDYNTGLAVDDANHTLYVVNFADVTLSMIDMATCRATVSTGCGHKPKVVIAAWANAADGFIAPTPDGIGLDTSAHTIYVVNLNSNNVSLIDASSCSATTSAGCARLRSYSLPVGGSPGGDMALDQATGTLYVANSSSNNVSVLNATTCNAISSVGCSH